MQQAMKIHHNSTFAIFLEFSGSLTLRIRMQKAWKGVKYFMHTAIVTSDTSALHKRQHEE